LGIHEIGEQQATEGSGEMEAEARVDESINQSLDLFREV
jgi:hypothetical protein